MEQFPTRRVGNPISVRQTELTTVTEIGGGETLAHLHFLGKDASTRRLVTAGRFALFQQYPCELG